MSKYNKRSKKTTVCVAIHVQIVQAKRSISAEKETCG